MMRHVILTALRRASQWRLLALIVLTTLLPALLATWPVFGMLGEALNRHPDTAQHLRQLNMLVLTDLAALAGKHAGIGYLALLAPALTVLAMPFIAGAAIGAARLEQRASWAQLMQAGLHDYWRMLRMMLVAWVPLGLAIGFGALLFALYEDARDKADVLASTDAQFFISLALGLSALILAHQLGERARAILALDRRRRSAFGALLSAIHNSWRLKLRALGVYLLIGVAGLLLGLVLMRLRLALPYWNAGSNLLIFVLTQLIVAVLAWARCARLFALMAVQRAEM